MGLSVCEKELMALVLAITKWRHYLVGNHFIIKMDHQSLKYLLEQRLTSNLQYKWLIKFLGLDYEIQYKRMQKTLWLMYYLEEYMRVVIDGNTPIQ